MEMEASGKEGHVVNTIEAEKYGLNSLKGLDLEGRRAGCLLLESCNIVATLCVHNRIKQSLRRTRER